MSYEIKFVCEDCKGVFGFNAPVRQKEGNWVRGLLCPKCGNQTKLELDFDV